MSIDDLLLEWSYKCEKGYPEIDNPSDMLVLESILKELDIPVEGVFNELSEEEKEKKPKDIEVKDVKKLLDRIKGDQEALNKIQRFILDRPIESTFFEKLASQSNITSKTVDTADAPKVLFYLLSEGWNLHEFESYNKPGFSSLGGSGNLLDFFSESGISKDSLKTIFEFSGKESGRGVGKGEVGLALLLKDVKMASAGAGDLDWNGKSLEVKGSNARLGKRDRSFGGFKNTSLGQLAIKYDKSDGMLKSLIPNLADEEGIDKNELLKAVIEFEEEAHPKGDAKKYFSKDILDKPKDLRKAFTKNLILNYTNEHNIDHYIWWNSSSKFGNYVSFAPKESDRLVDDDKISTNNIFWTYQLDPSISKP